MDRTEKRWRGRELVHLLLLLVLWLIRNHSSMVSLRLVLEHVGMVEKVNQDNEKPDIPIDLPSMDLWSNPCIQFTIKTLTGIGVDNPKGTKLSEVSNNRQQAKNVETTINGDKKQGCTAVLPSQDLAILVEHA